MQDFNSTKALRIPFYTFRQVICFLLKETVDAVVVEIEGLTSLGTSIKHKSACSGCFYFSFL